jgi:hypothetical protein
MSTTTGAEGRLRRPRRIIPWLAGLGIAATFAAAASLLFIEVASYLGDEAPQPTHAPEVAGVAALVALLVCLPRLSARVRAWGWSLSGVVAYLTVSTADWLADGSFLASPVLPLLAALSGGALLMAGVLLAYSGACARSSAATAP